MRTLAFLVIAVSVILARPQVAFACSCERPQTALDALAWSEFAFSGTVVEIVDFVPMAVNSNEQGEIEHLSFFFARFEVDRSWKGIDGEEVTLLSWVDDGATCGYTFELGEDYLVYGGITKFAAYGVQIETGEAGGYRAASACSRTSRLSETHAQDDIAALDGETAVTPSLWGQIKALFFGI